MEWNWFYILIVDIYLSNVLHGVTYDCDNKMQYSMYLHK